MLFTGETEDALLKVSGSTLFLAWQNLVAAAQASTVVEMVATPSETTFLTKLGQKNLTFPLDLFGLSSPAVAQVLEGLDGAQHCAR